MKFIGRAIFCISFILQLLLVQSAAPAFSVQEPRTVRVGWYIAPGLQEGSDEYSLYGYNYEYLFNIAQYANWNFKFVFGDFATLEQKLIDGEVDIIGDVAKTDSRLKRYAYCDMPSCYSRMLMVCRKNDRRFSYNEYSAFDGVVVATSPSEFRRSRLNAEAEKHHFNVTYLEVPTDVDMFAALDSGKADVAIFSDAIVSKDYDILMEWKPEAQYFIVNKEKYEILSELNQAMKLLQISDIFLQQRLFAKYFGNNSQRAFTKDEGAFLARVPELSVLLLKDQKPVSYIENGVANGFIVKYLSILEKNMGVKFKYIMCDSYQEMLTRFSVGEGDIVSEISDSCSLSFLQRYRKTRPYLNLSCGFVYNQLKDKKIDVVAVAENDSDLIKKIVSNGFHVVTRRTYQECLDAVSAGSADAAFMPSLIFDNFSYHARYERFVFKAQPQISYNLCLAVKRSDDNKLFLTLSKSAGAISQETRDQLLRDVITGIEPEYTWQDRMSLHRNSLFLLVLFLISCFYISRQLRSNEKLRRANSARESFFAKLSHDMRTPLTGILGYAELGVSAPEKEQQEYLKKIGESGQLLLALVNDALDLAKIEDATFKLKPDTYSIHEILDTVLNSIKGIIKKNCQHLNFINSIGQNEYISVDKLKLQDILLNLFSNAMKYTPSGGEILFRIERVEISNKIYYKYTIKDTGIGISSAFLPHIFEAFSQENGAVSQGSKGSGLGLSIVRRLVDLMHGTIAVESEKGIGSTFTLLLPVEIRPKPSVAAVEDVKTPDTRLQGMKLLLCEDNPVNQEIITRLLLKQGISVTCAGNGKEGAEGFLHSGQGEFQAILMDLRMPVLDGYAATSTIRAFERPDAKTIPIVALTADASAESETRCLACGMNACLSKPIDVQALFETLGRLIEDQPKKAS